MEDWPTAIRYRVQRARDFLSRLESLEGEAKALPAETRNRFPEFSGDWSMETVRKHVVRLEEAIREPIRYRSKETLERAGVDTEGLANEILEDRAAVEQVAEIVGDLREIDESLRPGEHASRWLKEGTEIALSRLGRVRDAEAGFRDVLRANIDAKLKSTLVEKSMTDTTYLTKARNVAQMYGQLRKYGVDLEYEGNIEGFLTDLEEAWGMIQKLQEKHDASTREIRAAVQGIKLAEVSKPLRKTEEDKSERRRQLQEEWQTYAMSLRAAGETVPASAESLRELEGQVKELRKKCREMLGESGPDLLAFLRGESGFPDIERSEIQRTLEALRPFFQTWLREVS